MEKLYNIYRNLNLIAFLASISCSSGEQQIEYSKMKEAEKIVANQFEKWVKAEASFFDLLDEDVVWTVSGRSPVSGTYNGKVDFLDHSVKPIVSKFKSPLKPELISITSDSSFVWCHFTAMATTVTNEVYRNTYLWKLQLRDGKIARAIAFLDTYELTVLMNSNNTATMKPTIEDTKEYIGMWVTKDGHIRHELLPNNRYDEARGNRKSAYQGSYTVSGNHIDYKDDTGFNADGEFKDGILYHGGMIFYKEK